MPGLLYSMPLTPRDVTVDPRICQRYLDTHRQVWLSLLWGHCSFLLGTRHWDLQALWCHLCLEHVWYGVPHPSTGGILGPGAGVNSRAACSPSGAISRRAVGFPESGCKQGGELRPADEPPGNISCSLSNGLAVPRQGLAHGLMQPGEGGLRREELCGAECCAHIISPARRGVFFPLHTSEH